MTILASTESHLVEYETLGRMLTLSRRTDGHCLALTGERIAGEFRDCLRTHDVETVVATWLRLALGAGCKWEPLYKPHALQPGGHLAFAASSHAVRTETPDA